MKPRSSSFFCQQPRSSSYTQHPYVLLRKQKNRVTPDTKKKAVFCWINIYIYLINYIYVFIQYIYIYIIIIIIDTYLINYPLKKKKKTSSQFCESHVVDFNFYIFINPYIISKIYCYQSKRIWTIENKINNRWYRSNWCRLHPYIFRNSLNYIWILKHLDTKPISTDFF